MEARIRQLEAMLEDAEIVEGGADDGTVAAGSRRRRSATRATTTSRRYLVGSIEESGDGIEIMSPGSPLGRRSSGPRPATSSSRDPRRHPARRDRLGGRRSHRRSAPLPPGGPARAARAGRTDLPAGDLVRSRGRGRRADRPAAPRLDARPPTSTGSRPTPPLAEHYRVVAIDHRGHGRGIRTAPPLPPGRLRRRRRGLADVLGIDRSSRSATRWAGRSPSSSGTATPTGSTASCCAPPPATSAATGPPPEGSPRWGRWPPPPASVPSSVQRRRRPAGHRPPTRRLGLGPGTSSRPADPRMVLEAGQAIGAFSSHRLDRRGRRAHRRHRDRARPGRSPGPPGQAGRRHPRRRPCTRRRSTTAAAVPSPSGSCPVLGGRRARRGPAGQAPVSCLAEHLDGPVQDLDQQALALVGRPDLHGGVGARCRPRPRSPGRPLFTRSRRATTCPGGCGRGRWRPAGSRPAPARRRWSPRRRAANSACLAFGALLRW